MAERRKPVNIISENGSNFVKADREFREYYAARNKRRLAELMIKQVIRGKFNLPANLQFGEAWKRLVKVTRKRYTQC